MPAACAVGTALNAVRTTATQTTNCNFSFTFALYHISVPHLRQRGCLVFRFRKGLIRVYAVEYDLVYHGAKNLVQLVLVRFVECLGCKVGVGKHPDFRILDLLGRTYFPKLKPWWAVVDLNH